MVAEAVEGFGVEGGGDEVLMARDGGGDGETFEVDDGGVAAVGDACAVGAGAIDTGDIAEVFDGASAEEGGPGLMAGGGPIGADDEEVVVQFFIPEPDGEAEVVADSGFDAPTAPLEGDAPAAAGYLRGFGACAEGMGLVVGAVGAVGEDVVEAVVDGAGLADGPCADEEGIVAGGEGACPLESGAFGFFGEGSHGVGEACGEGLGNDEDIGFNPCEGFFDEASVSLGVFPKDVLLEAGECQSAPHSHGSSHSILVLGNNDFIASCCLSVRRHPRMSRSRSEAARGESATVAGKSVI